MHNQKESKDKFIKQLAGFSIGPIVNAFIGFASVPITTWFLIPEELGKASMYTIAVEFLSTIIYLGLTRSYPREYYSSKNREKLLFNCVFIPFLLSIFILLLSLLFMNPISKLLFNDFSLLGIILFSITMPIKVTESFAFNLIRMQEKAKLFSLFQILKKVISFVLLVLFFTLITPTYHAVIISSVGSTLVMAIAQILNEKEVWLKALKSKPDLNILKKVLAYGLPLVPAAGLTWIFMSFDKIALRNFSNFKEIGYYSGAFKVISLLNILKKSFVSFWIPTSQRWFQQNENISKFKKVSDSLMSVFVSISALVIISRKIIFYLLSSKYLPSSNVFPFLLFIPIIGTVSQTTSIGIQFKRKNQYEIYTSLIAAAVNVIGNYLLVPIYGAVGAGISTCISYVLYFYIRSLFSAKVWKGIGLKSHTINLGLLLTLSFTTLLSQNNIFIEIGITLALLLYNIKNYTYIYKSLIGILKKRKSKK